MNPSFSRRQFVTPTAAAGLFQIVPRHLLGGPGHTPPSEKVNIAGIGLGWMGERNMHSCAGENIVALCDVDHSFAAKTFKAFPDAKVHKDYRVMLEKQKEIDAVLIATPDHTHAVISMAAMQAGKYVFCQKPLTHVDQKLLWDKEQGTGQKSYPRHEEACRWPQGGAERVRPRG